MQTIIGLDLITNYIPWKSYSQIQLVEKFLVDPTV